MADLRSITILPSQPVQGVAQPGVAQGSTSQSAPITLTQPAGTILNGFIVNRDASGNPILRTSTGDITFSSNFFLKIGSDVVIRVENSGGGTLAHILSVDGQSPQVAETLSSYAQEPDVILSQPYNPYQATASTQTAAAANAQAAPATEPSVILTGTIISQPSGNTTTPALPNGTQLTINVVTLNRAENITLPQAPAPTTAQSPAAQPANPSSYATYARAAVTPSVPQQSATAQTPAAPVVSPTIAAPPSPQAPVSTNVAVNEPTVQVPTTPLSTAIIQNQQAIAPQAVQTNVVAVQTPATAAPAAPTNNAAPLVAQQTSATIIPSAVTAADNVATPVNTAIPSSIPANIASLLPSLPTVNPPPVAVTSGPAVAVPSPNQPQAAAQPTAVSSALPANTQPTQVITATVIGHETTGEALVQTPVGVVRLQPGTVVPSGSTLTFTILQTTPPDESDAPVLSAAGPALAPIAQLAQRWTALQQVFSALSGRPTSTGLDTPQINIPISIASGVGILPQVITPQSMTAGLLLFISALRGGNFSNWLGSSNMKWLEDQGHDNLVQKAEGEFMGLARQFTAAAPQHWQPLFFPVAVDGQLQQVRMFIKRDRKQGNNNQKTKSDEDTRFVIEVDLTQLGELQMDGFVRRNNKDVQFDMVMRSLIPLSQEIQHDILRIYNDTGALTGYKGTLVFQSVKEFPINPMKDVIASMNTVVV